MRKKKKNIILLLVLLLSGLSIGYALLYTDLSINGISHVDSASWNVFFDSVEVFPGSVEADSPAIITSDLLTVEYTVSLTKPGDFYEFDVEVLNDGTIDAAISSITSTVNGEPITNLPSYFDYFFTYIDDVPVEAGNLLAAGERDTYRVHIRYKSNLNPSDLPTTDQTLSFSTQVTYVQADQTSSKRNSNYVYTLNPTSMIGEETNDSNGDETLEEMLDTFCHPFFIREIVSHNTVIERDIGFVFNSSYFYLFGSAVKYDYESPSYARSYLVSPYYEKNKYMMNLAFDSSNCQENMENNVSIYACDLLGIHAEVSTDGFVEIDDSEWYCDIQPNGEAICTHFSGAGYNCYSGI